MGYDIHLIRFVSGAPQPQPAGRIADLLRRASESPPDEHGFTRVSWCGGEADVYGVPRTADDPVDSVMFSRPAEGDGIFELMIEIARAGDMAILLPDGEVCLVDARHGEELPEDVAAWPRHMVRSGQELHAVVRNL